MRMTSAPKSPNSIPPNGARSGSPTPTPPSLPGDHTRALLVELGLNAQEITELVQAGVVAQSNREGR
ncbi:hypothetical protein A9X05_16495 [Mycobacterium sp. E3298]|nr:hypothetical protein A9X05_16495 [Mycobacterium sp. E3298]